jgi:predicted transcriptional regulator
MKTAISIPDDLFEKAEEVAERLKVSLSRLYARAIAEYTERHASQRVREKLDERRMPRHARRRFDDQGGADPGGKRPGNRR